jgi:hypothetical protein
MLTGVLILRSRLVPRVIGVMMIVAGVCYLTSSLAFVLSPSLSDRLVPWILLPSFLGELSLALSVAVRGVRAEAATPNSSDRVALMRCEAADAPPLT